MKTKILILAVLLSSALAAQVPAYVSTSGLQGWWPFTGNASDLSGNAYNGTVTGAVLTTDRFNVQNTAYLYNGSSDYISTAYPGILGADARAVSFWAAVDVSAPTHLEVVGWGDNDNTSASTGRRVNIAFNKIGADFYPSVSLAYCVWGQNPSPTVTNLVWHHYVFQVAVNSMVGDFEIYEDAVKLNNPTTSQNTATNTVLNTSNGSNMVTFGMLDQLGTPLFFFKGKLDDIGMWNRILDTCEIQALYHGQLWCGRVTGLHAAIEGNNQASLDQNAPNPFSESTVISYNIPVDFAKAQILFMSSTGIAIKAIDIIHKGTGSINITTCEFSRGLYAYALVIDGKVMVTKKMVKE